MKRQEPFVWRSFSSKKTPAPAADPADPHPVLFPKENWNTDGAVLSPVYPADVSQ